jgi:two-component system cell cycle sensor histidine kinase/response regulator CckA
LTHVNAQVARPERRLEDRLRILSRALRQFAEATTDYERLLDVVACTMAEVVADGCIVRLLSDQVWLTPVAYHLPLEARGLDAAAATRIRAFMASPQRVTDYAWGAHLIETGEPFLASPIDLTAVTAEVAAIYEAIGVHGVLVTVLRVRGESIGTLSLFRFDPASRPFDQGDLEMTQALADHAALAITNARLLQSVLRELAEREKAEAALRRTEEQLRQSQKMDAVGRLAGGVSHDFNNMLSVVLSYAGLILSSLGSDHPLRADIEQIQKAGERAAELTRQLLTFSRHQVVLPRILDLNQILAGMGKLLSRLLGAHIDLAQIPGARLGRVEADAGQVEQVIMNLALNARDAMPGGGKLVIQTRNAVLDEAYANDHLGVTPGSYVMLTIADTGTGMDGETQARIFEPFFTTKEQGKGTGLGLSIVFGIIKQSGGHVRVDSERGKGSTFSVYWPRTDAVAEESPSPLPAEETGRGAGTILLVEDEEQVRVVSREILRRKGYTVLEAPGAGEALILAEQFGARINLVVSDVVLPRMNGPELVERIRTLRPDTRVLFMSGYTDDPRIQRCMQHSGVTFLQKPITPDALVRKVREALAQP